MCLSPVKTAGTHSGLQQLLLWSACRVAHSDDRPLDHSRAMHTVNSAPCPGPLPAACSWPAPPHTHLRAELQQVPIVGPHDLGAHACAAVPARRVLNAVDQRKALPIAWQRDLEVPALRSAVVSRGCWSGRQHGIESMALSASAHARWGSRQEGWASKSQALPATTLKDHSAPAHTSKKRRGVPSQW